MKPLVVILSLVCVALAAQLVLRYGKGGRDEKEFAAVTTRVHTLSNEVAETRARAEEEARLAAFLQSNLTQRAAETVAVSNSLAQAAASLTAAQSELKAAQEEAKKQAARVAELEGQKDEMQTKLDELAGSIRTLNTQITETKRKLAASEGDRDSLTKELARLQSDKSDLLRQFNDLAALRAQVALLRDEAAINQRLAWMAQGVYQAAGRKGAEALVAKPAAPATPANPTLNVEVQQNGGANVVPPPKPAAQK
jgi:chromosome segregation ATPase